MPYIFKTYPIYTPLDQSAVKIVQTDISGTQKTLDLPGPYMLSDVSDAANLADILGGSVIEDKLNGDESYFYPVTLKPSVRIWLIVLPDGYSNYAGYLLWMQNKRGIGHPGYWDMYPGTDNLIWISAPDPPPVWQNPTFISTGLFTNVPVVPTTVQITSQDIKSATPNVSTSEMLGLKKGQ